MNQPSRKSAAKNTPDGKKGDGAAPPDGLLTAEEAMELLGIKRQTLYAYASRGLLRSVPSAEGRAHLYARSDLSRLKARRDARSGHGPVAASALRWGEPVLETKVSTIDERGPIYRGVPVVDLARRGATFEEAAALLWGEPHDPAAPWSAPDAGVAVAKLCGLLPESASPAAVLAVAVPAIAARDAERFFGPFLGKARALVLRMAAMLALPRRRAQLEAALAERSVARAVLTALGARPSAAAVRAIDRALVLCADHELNPSTFGVRVAASSGADLYACIGAGLAVLSGPEHGGAADRVEALAAELKGAGRSAAEVIAERARRGDAIPGFGHTIYRAGDPRGSSLLQTATELSPHGDALAPIRALVKAMAAAGQEPPTVDVGLVAVSAALGLPAGSAAGLFAIGRTAGWIAHAIEQRGAGYIVRPRARYTGP